MKRENGITLIALIITTIVLLILAGTAISIAINGGDIFSKASEARETWNVGVETEEKNIKDVMEILKSVDLKITMTLDGTEVELTRENFGEHLGKVATKYIGAPTTINNKNISNTYRLYWIDWDNKYKDGIGTIYLKADVPENGGSALEIEEIEGNIEPENSLVRTLNPGIYVESDWPLNTNNYNMKAVRWLLNPSNWNSLIISRFSSKTNYVVGAPSLPMMVDSYNKHYQLTGNTPIAGDRTTSSPRTKLFYIFYSFGYRVGPASSNEYDEHTANYTVQTDENIDSMYYPGDGKYYWLSSPDSHNSYFVMDVIANQGGQIRNNKYDTSYNAFCPLVSLQPDIDL